MNAVFRQTFSRINVSQIRPSFGNEETLVKGMERAGFSSGKFTNMDPDNLAQQTLTDPQQAFSSEHQPVITGTYDRGDGTVGYNGYHFTRTTQNKPD